jgi:hypothetical protein
MARLSALSALLLLAIALAGDVNAGPSVESDSFRLILPDGWAIDPQARRTTANGPKGEVFWVGSITAPATRSKEETRTLLQDVERRSVAIITEIEKNTAFRTLQPLSSQRLADGSAFHQIVAGTKDGRRQVAQFVVAGPRTVLTATLNVRQRDAAAIDAIASALRNVEWRQ